MTRALTSPATDWYLDFSRSLPALNGVYSMPYYTVRTRRRPHLNVLTDCTGLHPRLSLHTRIRHMCRVVSRGRRNKHTAFCGDVDLIPRQKHEISDFSLRMIERAY